MPLNFRMMLERIWIRIQRTLQPAFHDSFNNVHWWSSKELELEPDHTCWAMCKIIKPTTSGRSLRSASSDPTAPREWADVFPTSRCCLMAFRIEWISTDTCIKGKRWLHTGCEKTNHLSLYQGVNLFLVFQIAEFLDCKSCLQATWIFSQKPSGTV